MNYLCHSRKKTLVKPLKYIKVKRLKKIVKCFTQVDNTYLDFLEETPLTANYSIEYSYSITNWKKYGSVRGMFTRHLKSTTKLKTHLELCNVTDECEIGFSKSQYEQLQKIFNTLS